ncbi:DUF4394 domain-containing protein [Dyadobacter sp. CY326]|uniref:DUF4394 domain-containing protein n=1 Tax=Dyadobacter sp. CY326 TaxID=2907300 RepID=UPI001F333FD6|nr:DUF4394 domain-containing protein [Dyadobacter sp. CY326]MCE7067023.1 DUF4394 domain-containing protein [Dyadobacter sp. CY326]
MKILNNSLRHLAIAASFALALFITACEDHRVPPTQQTLPDRIFYALSDNNQIHEINVRNTSTPIRTITVEGLVGGDVLAGIDFRPATGQLYAISTSSNLYHINIKSGDQSGKATRVGASPIATALNGGSIGFDFNPTVDKIRVVTTTGQNLRVHPETGAVVANDGPLNGPASPKVGAVAYTNSRAGVTAAPAGAGTTLYDIDAEANVLYTQNPPNAGTLVPVGPLGLDITEVGGFDISPDVNAADVYPIASVKFDGKWELDFVNLATGELQKLGDLPAGVNITGIAIPSMPVAYALDGSNNLKIFNPTNGAEYGTKAISIPGVTLEGIDIRPVNGKLYALGGNSKIYGIDLGSGVATEIAGLADAMGNAITLSGTRFGVDFNPVADRLRVVSDNGQNLRINVENGVTIVDGALLLGAATPSITAVAYTNSYPGVTAATGTTLYDIDSQSNTIHVQTPPNAGTLQPGKPLGVDVDAAIGFDIGNFTGTGYAIFTVGGSTGFYTVDVATGATQLKYAFSTPVKGLATGFGL